MVFSGGCSNWEHAQPRDGVEGADDLDRGGERNPSEDSLRSREAAVFQKRPIGLVPFVGGQTTWPSPISTGQLRIHEIFCIHMHDSLPYRKSNSMSFYSDMARQLWHQGNATVVPQLRHCSRHSNWRQIPLSSGQVQGYPDLDFFPLLLTTGGWPSTETT